MSQPQPAIFAEGTRSHWFVHYSLGEGVDPTAVPDAIAAVKAEATDGPPTDAVNLVTGFGRDLLSALAPDATPDGLRPFAEISGPGGHVAVATQEDLFFWAHSNQHDRNFEVVRAAKRALDGVATLARETISWVYRDSRDLFGFIDGTENPAAEEARELAVVSDGPGEGGSYILTQRYIHDLDRFAEVPVADQERIVGRTKDDSVELEEQAPESHLSRVVYEEDGEEVEIYRRSVPYGDSHEAGLYFLAFTDDLAKVQTMLDNMYGVSGDGIHDGLMDFSHPVSGAYYFAPPVEVLDEILG